MLRATYIDILDVVVDKVVLEKQKLFEIVFLCYELVIFKDYI